MAHPRAALPFLIRRQHDVVHASEVTSTTEAIHGVLRLEVDALVVQWSTARESLRVGRVIETTRALDPVREVRIPFAGLAGAALRWQWRRWPPGPTFVLLASDLHAFAGLAGGAGLVLEHPAELTLGIRRQDRATARDFASELELQLADLALGAAEGRQQIGAGERSPPAGRLPRGGSA